MIAVITDEFRKTLRKLNDKNVNKKVLEAIENIENAQTKQDIRGLKNYLATKPPTESALAIIGLVFTS
jgi:hypothetical protein